MVMQNKEFNMCFISTNKQPDVSEFHHLQGVVWMSRMSVYLTTPVKIPGLIIYCFLTNTKVVWSFNCRPNISEFTRRNQFKIQCLNPF